ncbi:hypothetical protein ACK3TF_003232 [Chlorella vulgaris]
MAIRRRRPASKAPTGPTSRVHAVDSVAQWRNLLAKAASSNRVVVVQFFRAQNYACSQMRPFFRRMSVDPALKAAVFVEVEVDNVEDELLLACNVRQGVDRIPGYRCYVAGEVAEAYVGGVPAEVAKMVARQLALVKGSGGGLLSKLLLAAGVAAAAAAAYWHLTRKGSSGEGGGRDIAAEMLSLSERINVAQQRLRGAERAGRLKAAKTQQGILRKLKAEQSRLQQQLAQRQHGSDDDAEGEKASGGGGKSRRKSRRAAAAAAGSDEEEQGQAEDRKAEPGYYSSDDEERQRLVQRLREQRRQPRTQPQVLYSEEEEEEEALEEAVVAVALEEEQEE